jgi:hypothetical protein
MSVKEIEGHIEDIAALSSKPRSRVEPFHREGAVAAQLRPQKRK